MVTGREEIDIAASKDGHERLAAVSKEEDKKGCEEPPEEGATERGKYKQQPLGEEKNWGAEMQGRPRFDQRANENGRRF